jgi:hypothetical protein
MLRGQDPSPPVFWVKLRFTVTDDRAKYIQGLKPRDFRVREDGILQKIQTFAEGVSTPLRVNEDGTTSPLVNADIGGGKPGIDLTLSNPFGDDLDNCYTITYFPEPRSREGFRKLDIQIVSDVARKWRVRMRSGYRPQE